MRPRSPPVLPARQHENKYLVLTYILYERVYMKVNIQGCSLTCTTTPATVPLAGYPPSGGSTDDPNAL